MYIISKITLAAAAMIITASCVKTEDTASGSGIPDGGGTIEGNRVEMTFQLTTSDMSRPTVSIPLQSADNSSSMTVTMNDPVTRAETDPDENKITGLWVLQFESTAPEAKLVSREYYSSEDIVDSSKVAVSFIEADGNIRAYFVANVGADHFSSLPVGSSTTLSAFEAMVCNFNPSATVPANGLPMVGSYDGLPSTMGGIVTLKRMVAKIDFTCIVDLASAAESFTVREVQLKSAAAFSAYVAPSVPTDESNPYPASDRNNFVNGEKATITDGESGEEPKSYSYTWYVSENLRGVKSGLSETDKGMKNAPDRSTYIEVTGDYTKAGETLFVSYRIYPGRNATDNFNIERNYLYSITSTIKGMDESDTRVVIGEDLSVNGTANCYMVHKAGTLYRFNATVMGNGEETDAFTNPYNNAISPAITPTTLEPDDVKVLWETGEKGSVIEDGTIMIKGDEVFFTTAGEEGDNITEGNAVIGVFEDGTLVWSWHIWSTKYDPDNDFATLVNSSNKTYHLMKYNLGATVRAGYKADDAYNFVPESYGLLYQWGRKDPFIGSAAASGTTAATTTPYDSNYEWNFSNITVSTDGVFSEDPVAYAIKHPTHFIKNGSGTHDWVSATDIKKQRDNLWGNPNDANTTNDQIGSKSIYDPCPVGWRVPPQDTWTRFSMSMVNGGFSNGYMFYTDATKTNTSFFPATGCRDGSHGNLFGASTYGYYWSSSPYSSSGSNAGLLSFYSGYVGSLFSNYRINGFSVRCVKEMEENE